LFGIGFVAWNYYPHTFGLPILKTTAIDGAAAPAAASTAPVAPPVTAPPQANPASPMAPTPTPSAPGDTH
ncbi:MAG: hypothetical protein ACRECE_09775, partial [Xanthobacteraceae bacterium]